MNINNLEAHELADLFPILAGEEFDQLVADIKARGLLERITLYEGKILDGRNRYNAAKEAGLILGPEDVELFEEMHPGRDPAEFVISRNVMRRHLTTEQRSRWALKLYRQLDKPRPGGDRQSKKALSPNGENASTAQEQKQKAAAIAGVSTRSMDRAAAAEKPKRKQPGWSAEIDSARVRLKDMNTLVAQVSFTLKDRDKAALARFDDSEIQKLCAPFSGLFGHRGLHLEITGLKLVAAPNAGPRKSVVKRTRTI